MPDFTSQIMEGIETAARTESLPVDIDLTPDRPLAFIEDDPRLAADTTVNFLSRHSRRDEEGAFIPLDTETGVDFLTRSKVGLTDNEERQQELLQQAFKGSVVEPIEGGNFIIRGVKDPETGAQKDLLFDERSMSSGDIADLSKALLGTGAAFAALAALPATATATTGMGIAATIARLGVMATASTGAAKSAEALGEASTVLGTGGGLEELRDVGKQSLKELPGEGLFDLGLGLLPLGMGRMVDRAVTGGRGFVQTQGIEAIGRIKQKTGITIPLSVGESTGRPFILRAEGITEKTPVGGGMRNVFVARQEQAIRDVERYLLGGEGLPRLQDVNARALRLLQEHTNLTDERLLAETLANVKAGSDFIKNQIMRSTPLARVSVGKQATGEVTRGALRASHAAFRARAEKLYEPILRVDPKFNVAPIKKQVAEIRKQFTKSTIPESKKIVDTGMVGERGEAITKEVIEGGGREPIPEFIPSGLSRTLQGFDKLDDEIPLSELRNLRTQINDALSDGQILDDVPSKRLKELASSITRAIEEGVDALPSDSLKFNLERANSFYRNNIERFQVKGVNELLATSTQKKIGPFRVVNEASQDPDQYFRLKEALTSEMKDLENPEVRLAGLAAFDTLKRSILDTLTGNALAGSNVMNVKRFAELFSGLEAEMADDLLGKGSQGLLNEALSRGLIDENVPIEMALKALRKPGATADSLERMVKASKKESRIYKNSIVQRLVKGNIDEGNVRDFIRSDEFVDKYLDIGSLDEVEEVMSIIKLDPDLYEDVQRRTIHKIFLDAARTVQPEDTLRSLDAEPEKVLKSIGIAKILGDENTRNKLSKVIEPEAMSILGDLARVASMREQKDKATDAVGGLVAGGLMADIMTLSPKSFGKHIGYGVAAAILSNPVTRAIATRAGKGDRTKMVQAMLIASPVLRSLLIDETPDVATSLGIMVGDSVGLNAPSPDEGGFVEEDFTAQILSGLPSLEEPTGEAVAP